MVADHLVFSLWQDVKEKLNPSDQLGFIKLLEHVSTRPEVLRCIQQLLAVGPVPAVHNNGVPRALAVEAKR